MKDQQHLNAEPDLPLCRMRMRSGTETVVNAGNDEDNEDGVENASELYLRRLSGCGAFSFGQRIQRRLHGPLGVKRAADQSGDARDVQKAHEYREEAANVHMFPSISAVSRAPAILWA